MRLGKKFQQLLDFVLNPRSQLPVKSARSSASALGEKQQIILPKNRPFSPTNLHLSAGVKRTTPWGYKRSDNYILMLVGGCQMRIGMTT
jgi:hypothetical protein